MCAPTIQVYLWESRWYLNISLDAFNKTAVLADIKRTQPELSPSEVIQLVAYAVTGAGMVNAHKLIQNASNEDLDRLRSLFSEWINGRSLMEFYNHLFVDSGYSCQEVGRWLIAKQL